MIPFSPEREEHLAVGVMSVAGLSQAISESWKHNTGNQIARMYNARINLLCLIWHKRVNYKLLCNITPPPPDCPHFPLAGWQSVVHASVSPPPASQLIKLTQASCCSARVRRSHPQCLLLLPC